MWAMIDSVGQNVSVALGFFAGLLAPMLLILAWRGPAYIAAYTVYRVAMREQKRLDRAMPREAEPRELPLLDPPIPVHGLERAARPSDDDAL